MRRVALISFLLAVPLWAQLPEEDIRGPKPLIKVVPREQPSAWPMVALIGLIFLLLIAGIVWWMKRRAKPGLTAEQWARQELDGLQRTGDGMMPGDFAVAASRVVRIFIERKFGLAAPKRTTEEFLHELTLAKNEALASRMESLRGFLKSCDMAKFAAADLEGGERDELITKAKAFVDAPEKSQRKGAA